MIPALIRRRSVEALVEAPWHLAMEISWRNFLSAGDPVIAHIVSVCHRAWHRQPARRSELTIVPTIQASAEDVCVTMDGTRCDARRCARLARALAEPRARDAGGRRP